MSDETLAQEAFALLNAATAPLTAEEYAALRKKLDAIIAQAEDKDALRDITAEPLLRLNPDEEID